MKKSLFLAGKYLSVSLFSLGITSVDISAQGLMNRGGKISITSGAVLTVNDGNYRNVKRAWNIHSELHMSSGTALHIKNGNFINERWGYAYSAGTIYVDGDWENYDAYGVFGRPPTASTGGLVRLNGATQDIRGSWHPTNFYNLQIEGSDKKRLDGIPTFVYGTLTLSSQSVLLNKETLYLANAGLGPAAISNSGGFLISETGPADGGWQYGTVAWKMPPSSTGNYVIPFGTDATNPVDISFGYNITTAGTPISGWGDYRTFATYDTDSENSFTGTNITVNPDPSQWTDLPFWVENLTDGYNQAAHYFTTDRFWIIDQMNMDDGKGGPGGYSVRPELEYVFTYLHDEIATPNHITEANLVPQRYNEDEDAWGDWLYGNPAVITNTTANTVTVQIGADATTWTEDMHSIWTLVDSSDPLPIELTAFEGSCINGKIEINWTTWTETNNDFFTVERSNNGTEFEIVDIVEGSGNSNEPISYTALDDLPYGGTSYYRLKSTDFAGKAQYSEILAITCGADGTDFSFTNAYVVDNHDFVVEFIASENENYTVKLLDASGRLMLDTDGVGFDGRNKVRLNTGDLARGIYVINLSNGTQTYSKRVMLQ